MMPAFTHPQFLLPGALLAGLVLLAGLWAQTRPGVGVRVSGQRPWLLGLGASLMVGGLGLGLAEPHWGLPEHPRLTVHVLLDASRSMTARDAGGRTRWEAATGALDRLWAEPRAGLRWSLDLVTGDLVPVLPPGEDRGLLRDALRALTPGDMGSPGTSLGRAITQAVGQVREGEPAVLLLVGDGEETWEASDQAEAHALQALKQAKLPLFAKVVGGSAPVPVALPGQPDATSAARPDALQRLAEASGGRLLRPDEELAEVLLALAQGRAPLPVARSHQPAHPEWGAWLALAGLALWMLGAGRPMHDWRIQW